MQDLIHGNLFIGVAFLFIVLGLAIWIWGNYKKGKLFKATQTELNRHGLRLKTVEQNNLFEFLVRADFGVEMAALIAEEPGDLEAKLATFVEVPEHPNRNLNTEIQPSVFLFIGVNGVGKTTTIGKLARRLRAQNKSVLLVAADTFRAAGTEQLQTWAAEVGAEIEVGLPQADPGSIAYAAVQRAKAEKIDFVLIDTAGRLQNKSDLMNELKKIKRVIEKILPISETLLVLDATTGQNGLAQAKAFNQAVNVTGIVLTKFDSSAKGGMVFNVQRALARPVKLLGTGEGVADLETFNPQDFVRSLL
jgi:fused signal recognition particle receptor